jgi:uncharacterized SAM-binding protein YcdF (DUF218 family)
VLWAVLARSFAPSGNTAQTRFDAIIILGASIDSDGNPSPTLLSRMTEGVREYERGVAPRILVTGGMQNGHIQADIMAHIAEAQGVPASAILKTRFRMHAFPRESWGSTAGGPLRWSPAPATCHALE